MASRLTHLLDCYRELRDHGEPLVMATIVETLGSTYQKAGARLLIGPDGASRGLLSGGCFENDLREHALSLLNAGGVKELFYDMRSPDEAIWGLGLGCNGAVRVLLQVLTPETDYFPLNRIETTVANKHAEVLATVCTSEHRALPAGRSFFINPETAGGTGVQQQLTLQSRRVWLEQRPQALELEHDGRSVTVFYDIIRPPPEILVIGAGPDAVPLVTLASKLGWRMTLVDHRPAYLKAEAFPGAAELVHCYPDALGRTVDMNAFSAVVLMTHNIEYDARFLKEVAGSAVPYIGLLGPAKRRDRLLAGLDGQVGGRCYGPVGLDLGAETPEEIALSIVAEIQAVMKQRDGVSLSLKDLPIQTRTMSN